MHVYHCCFLTYVHTHTHTHVHIRTATAGATCRKILLTKGLRFMMEVFHLFPPLDQLAAEAKAFRLRMEALSASQLILEQLLTHVIPAPVNEEQEQQHTTCTDGIGDGDMESGELDEDSDFPSLEPESDWILLVVTDEMREVDKQSRLQVLLKLLQLACVMVRMKSSNAPLLDF